MRSGVPLGMINGITATGSPVSAEAVASLGTHSEGKASPPGASVQPEGAPSGVLAATGESWFEFCAESDRAQIRQAAPVKPARTILRIATPKAPLIRRAVSPPAGGTSFEDWKITRCGRVVYQASGKRLDTGADGRHATQQVWRNDRAPGKRRSGTAHQSCLEHETRRLIATAALRFQGCAASSESTSFSIRTNKSASARLKISGGRSFSTL